MALTRDQEKAIFANLADKKSVRVGILRPLKNTERLASEFTVIPLGSASRESENFGLPVFTIPRAEALRIRKENMFDLQSDGSHFGSFPVKDFKRLVKQDPKAFSSLKTSKQKQEVKEKPLPKEKEGTSEDPHQIPQTILDQLLASKVNGFPFFKFTGIKNFVLLGNESLLLKDIPRNPNKISSVTITYDVGRDLYNILFQKGKFPKNVPSGRVDGVFFDQLAEIIAREMGVL